MSFSERFIAQKGDEIKIPEESEGVKSENNKGNKSNPENNNENKERGKPYGDPKGDNYTQLAQESRGHLEEIKTAQESLQRSLEEMAGLPSESDPKQAHALETGFNDRA